ncbi:MAG: sigma 54-dependent Fis family transcriptional regulator [Deltaproteobacteria bacterium]|nr:sigma 54-dependent Fis family transcriptional regulator [Deltaproteobacteria bacterium]
MGEDPAITTIFDGGRATVRHLRKSKLVIVSGAEAGKEYDLTKPRVGGGRSIINDIPLSDKAISGTHFEIVGDDDGYRLVDLGSTNGTFVGDIRIKDVYLRPGTTFRAGHTELRFQPLNEVVEIQLSARDRFDCVLGGSVKMREIFATLEKIAPSDLTVMITGETGTGKELVARAIHNMSPRRSKPFQVLDCGAIPRDLIESTLFGHEKGSFTGAIGQHKGCFEQAHGGTIFLDEIGELDVGLQPKLLRVLENRELKRVGGDKTIKIDVRVLAATNRDLKVMVNQGTFREDLYFRLSVILVDNPPLRDRKEDIPQLVHHFLADVARRRGMSMNIAVDSMTALMGHNWPGNVRELRNVVERAASLCDGPTITRADLVFGRSGLSPAAEAASAAAAAAAGGGAAVAGGGNFAASLLEPGVTFKDAKQQVLDDFERLYLAKLLERNKGNITRSAHEAGLTRYHLRELLKRHNLSSGN